MSRQYVALDVEATGGKDLDEIIELAAVRFTAEGVLDTWHSFVRPQRSVGLRTQVLTGIRDAEVAAAPRFADVAPAFRQFLGNDPLVAHSVELDLERLSKAGLSVSNIGLDTYELSGLLLPGLPGYSLAQVAAHCGVVQESQHRALSDADVTRQVFLHLLNQASSFDARLLQQIVHLIGEGQWPLKLVFLDAATRSTRTAFIERPGMAPADSTSPASRVRREAINRLEMAPALFRAVGRAEPLEPRVELEPVTDDAVRAVFDPDGPLANRFPAYESRPQQVAMSLAVAERLRDGGQLLVEAGTGTGKSLAYLVPALLHATLNDDRVVVSTNTVNLQDQLFGKDVPDLAAALEPRFRATVVKGRHNYLCLLRWAEFRQRHDMSALESRLTVKVLIWLSQSPNGDVADLNLNQDESALWWHICCTRETCINDACTYKQQHGCYLFNARYQAESAHLVIVNHALLLSDIASDSQVLPAYRNLIVDEAHHLEEEATKQLGFEIDQRSLATFLNDIASRPEGGRTLGLATDIRTALSKQSASGKRPLARASELEQQTERARQRAKLFFQEVGTFFGRTSDGPRRPGTESQQRIVRSMRLQPDWASVDVAWRDLATVLTELQGSLEHLHMELGLLDETRTQGLDGLKLIVQSLGRQCLETRTRVESLIAQPHDNDIYWVSLDEPENIMLHAAPLHVGELLSSLLYAEKRTVVMTSATMTVHGDFAYLRERLSLNSVSRTERIGSPFDYKRQALLYIPADMPEPNQQEYQHATEQAILALAIASQGRALVLFTSHNALRTTYAAIKGPLEQHGVLLLGQGIDGSRKQLLAMLRNHENTVLMGSNSFWEGVDVAGPALSALVIVRLPFSVPSDPVFAARSEGFDNPFAEYAVPQAVLRFEQGFGRLIRGATDRGVVLVLDRRIISKAYGQIFQRSIPTCTTQRGAMSGISAAVERWLDPKRVTAGR